MAGRDHAAAETYFAELMAAYPKSRNVHYLYGLFLAGD